jgi:hypothetical protein
MIMRLLRALLGLQPAGFKLIKSDGGVPGAIRGDLVPADTLVIVDGGRRFVRTGKIDDQGFEVYAEGHKTFEYYSQS